MGLILDKLPATMRTKLLTHRLVWPSRHRKKDLEAVSAPFSGRQFVAAFSSALILSVLVYVFVLWVGYSKVITAISEVNVLEDILYKDALTTEMRPGMRLDPTEPTLSESVPSDETTQNDTASDDQSPTLPEDETGAPGVELNEAVDSSSERAVPAPSRAASGAAISDELMRALRFRVIMRDLRVGDIDKIKSAESLSSIEETPYKHLVEPLEDWFESCIPSGSNLNCATVRLLGEQIKEGMQASFRGVPGGCSYDQDKNSKIITHHLAAVPAAFTSDSAAFSAVREGKALCHEPQRATWQLAAHWRPSKTLADSELLDVFWSVGYGAKWEVPPGVNTEDERQKREIYLQFLESLMGAVRAHDRVREADRWLVFWRGGEQFLILFFGFLTASLIVFRRFALQRLKHSATKANLEKTWETAQTSWDSEMNKLGGNKPQSVDEALEALRYSDEVFGSRYTAAEWCIEQALRWKSLGAGFKQSTEFRAAIDAALDGLRGSRARIDWALAFVLPIGFLGTVLGIMMALSDAHTISAATDLIGRTNAIMSVAGKLGLAFTTTAIALIVSTVLGRMLRWIELEEEDALHQVESFLTLRHREVLGRTNGEVGDAT